MSFVLIAGCTRSGTTLLARAMDRHREIFVAPETHFFSQVWSQRRLVTDTTSARYRGHVARTLMAKEYPDLGLFRTRQNQIEEALAASPNMHEQFFHLLAALSDAPILAEKTPWHAPLANAILSGRPDGKLLAIVRHPAATVASVRSKPGFRRVATVLQCVARWCLINRAIGNTIERLGPERALLIRYEDLVTDSAGTLARVCAFLGVEPGADLLDPRFNESSHAGARKSENGFDAGRIDLWREALTPEEQDRILALTAPLASSFGYTDSVRQAGWRDRLALAAEMTFQNVGVSLMKLGLYPLGGLIGPAAVKTDKIIRSSERMPQD